MEAVGPRVRWPLGKQLRYRLSWRTSTNVRALAGGKVRGSVDSGGESEVEGTLVLQVARVAGTKATLIASFADLKSARFALTGQPDVPAELAIATLTGPSAAIERTRRRPVRSTTS